MKHSVLRYLTGAGVAGLIGLGGVGLAHAQSDDTGTTDTVVDDPTAATDGTAVDDGTATHRRRHGHDRRRHGHDRRC